MRAGTVTWDFATKPDAGYAEYSGRKMVFKGGATRRQNPPAQSWTLLRRSIGKLPQKREATTEFNENFASFH
jgi:hypothetical protein